MQQTEGKRGPGPARRLARLSRPTRLQHAAERRLLGYRDVLEEPDANCRRERIAHRGLQRGAEQHRARAEVARVERTVDEPRERDACRHRARDAGPDRGPGKDAGVERRAGQLGKAFLRHERQPLGALRVQHQVDGRGGQEIGVGEQRHLGGGAVESARRTRSERRPQLRGPEDGQRRSLAGPAARHLPQPGKECRERRLAARLAKMPLRLDLAIAGGLVRGPAHRRKRPRTCGQYGQQRSRPPPAASQLAPASISLSGTPW